MVVGRARRGMVVVGIDRIARGALAVVVVTGAVTGSGVACSTGAGGAAGSAAIAMVIHVRAASAPIAQGHHR